MPTEYNNIILQEGQTLIDIAIETYGCYEGVFLIMEDNNLTFDSILSGGDVLKIRDITPTLNTDNKEVIKQYSTTKTNINSGLIFIPDPYVTSSYVDDNYVNP